MKKKETTEEKEKRDAAAYARIPQQVSEIEEWEPEQVWIEDEEGEPEETIQPTSATAESTEADGEGFRTSSRNSPTSSKDGTTAIVLRL